MSETVVASFVGGPLHHTKREIGAWGAIGQRYVVPDAADMLHVVFDSGESMTLFGQHTYVLDCYLANGQERYLYRYEGYVPPKCPKCAIVAGGRTDCQPPPAPR